VEAGRLAFAGAVTGNYNSQPSPPGRCRGAAEPFPELGLKRLSVNPAWHHGLESFVASGLIRWISKSTASVRAADVRLPVAACA
jgi:hypothetical protein